MSIRASSENALLLSIQSKPDLAVGYVGYVGNDGNNLSGNTLIRTIQSKPDLAVGANSSAISALSAISRHRGTQRTDVSWSSGPVLIGSTALSTVLISGRDELIPGVTASTLSVAAGGAFEIDSSNPAVGHAGALVL